MSAADQLRRAAAKLREHATVPALTPGPWECLNDGDRIVRFKTADAWDFEYVVDEPVSNTANAELIALMHPPVALALAEWLDATAERIEVLKPVVGHEIYGVGHPQEFIERTYAKSLAVARAVLREDEGGAT